MTHVAELVKRIPLAVWVPRGVPPVRVVREAEAAYDAQAATSVATGAPPAPLVPGSPRRVLRSRPRLPTVAPLARLCIRDDQDVVLIPIRSVLYARHDGGQTTIESDQQSLNVRLTLDRLERVLAPFGFLRSHRAFLVNLRWVRRIVTWSRHVQNLLLDDSKETLGAAGQEQEVCTSSFSTLAIGTLEITHFFPKVAHRAFLANPRSLLAFQVYRVPLKNRPYR